MVLSWLVYWYMRRITSRLGGRLSPSGPLCSIRFWIVGALCLLLAGTLLSGAIASAERTQVSSAYAQLRDRLRPAQIAAVASARAYVDQETGLRGFVSTGEPTLRQRLDQLTARVDELTQAQLQIMTKAQDRANLVTALVIAASLLVATIAGITLHRMTTRPLSRLLRDLSEVTEDPANSTRHITATSGAYELQVISTAAEQMRTGLVSSGESLAHAQRELGIVGERDRMAEQVRRPRTSGEVIGPGGPGVDQL